MDLLDCPIQPYPWGSTTELARLQAREPTGGPEAELWIGAHPLAPARLRSSGGSLADAVASDPAHHLGEPVARRYAGTLPFLLKVLAAASPLSLQAHPSRAQAEAGYDAEQQAGVPLDSPARRYKDRWPKPELVVACTPFVAMCGFRDPAESAALVRRLGVPALGQLAERLDGGPGELPAAVRDQLTMPRDECRAVVAAIGEQAQRLAGVGVAEARWWARLAAGFPGDPGVVCALLLNVVELPPGTGLHLPAGRLHAYLCGTAIEVMANSDNVLRGGLTSKHVDVEELLAVVDPHAGPLCLIQPVREGVEEVYPVEAEEFRLSRVRADGSRVELDARGPQLLLCVAGQVEVTSRAGGEPVVLRSGTAGYSPAAEGGVVMSGKGEVFRVTPGL